MEDKRVQGYDDEVDADYGYSVDNPIRTFSIQAAYFYLGDLRYNGEPIEYERIGSFNDANGDFVDGYNIFAEENGKTVKVATIYINSYCREIPDTAPRGFTLD